MASTTARSPAHAQTGATPLLLIALFKLVKAALLIAVGICALKLLHRDVAETVGHWVEVLRVDPENHFIHGVLTRLVAITPQQLAAASVGTFIYAALLLTEGVGLWLRKRWAEYFTIITTAGLIPVEIYELSKHLTAGKIGILLANIAIVLYLLVRVRNELAARE